MPWLQEPLFRISLARKITLVAFRELAAMFISEWMVTGLAGIRGQRVRVEPSTALDPALATTLSLRQEVLTAPVQAQSR